MKNKKLLLSLCLILFATTNRGNSAPETSSWTKVCNFCTGTLIKVQEGMNYLIEIGKAKRGDAILQKYLDANGNVLNNVERGAAQIQEVTNVLTVVKDTAAKVEVASQGNKLLFEKVLTALTDNATNVDTIGQGVIFVRQDTINLLNNLKKHTDNFNQFQAGVEAGNKYSFIKNTCTGIATVAGVFVIIRTLQGGYYWLYPNKEDQAHKEMVYANAKKQLAILKAEKGLYESLVENAAAKRDEDGLPTPCREAATLFEKAAGPEALSKIIEAFNKRKNRCEK